MKLAALVQTKLGELRDARKLSAVAQQTGISQASLSRAAAGQQDLGLEAISKLVDFLGLTVSPCDVEPSSYTMVPKVTARAGAGSSLVTDESLAGFYAFRLAFLQRVGIDGNHSVMLDVLGDSMFPLIQNGDTILVDQSDTRLQDGKIYLVSLGEELLVKRLQKTVHGWLLVSQNSEFAPIPVENTDDAAFRVHGRVRWFGRVL